MKHMFSLLYSCAFRRVVCAVMAVSVAKFVLIAVLPQSDWALLAVLLPSAIAFGVIVGAFSVCAFYMLLSFLRISMQSVLIVVEPVAYLFGLAFSFLMLFFENPNLVVAVFGVAGLLVGCLVPKAKLAKADSKRA